MMIAKFYMIFFHHVYNNFLQDSWKILFIGNLIRLKYTFSNFREGMYKAYVTFQHSFRPLGYMEEGKL